MEAAQLLVSALSIYGGLGTIFAVAFVSWGIKRVDPVARRASLGFRLIVAPGSAAFWPLLLLRWVQAVRQ